MAERGARSLRRVQLHLSALSSDSAVSGTTLATSVTLQSNVLNATKAERGVRSET